MPDTKVKFDSVGFFKALEATVYARGLMWKHVSEQTGVSASTLSRMAQGRGPDSASQATLAAWSGLNPADFVVMANKPSAPEPLAQVARYLRRDPRLSKDAAEAIDQVLKTTYARLANKKR